LTDSADIQVI